MHPIVRNLPAALLLLALTAPAGHAALSPPDPFSGGSTSSGALSTGPDHRAFTGGAPYSGRLDLGALVPVTVTGYRSGGFFFLDTGEGTGDLVSISGISGYLSYPVTYFVPASVTQVNLLSPADEDFSQPGSGSPVPLPPALLLLGGGLAGLLGLRRNLLKEAV